MKNEFEYSKEMIAMKYMIKNQWDLYVNKYYTIIKLNTFSKQKAMKNYFDDMILEDNGNTSRSNYPNELEEISD